MKGRLNIFQTGMLRWRELYAYNAVHVVRVEAPLARNRLEGVIEARLRALGLTGLTLDAARGRYEYRGGPAHARLRVLPAGADALPVVTREIEIELNEAFPHDGAIDPFRFFAVDAGTHFHLGVAYDHFVAGGDSIVLLLKGLADAYVAPSSAATEQPLERYPATFRNFVFRHPWHVMQGMRHLRTSLATGRRAFRPRYPGGDDMRVGFTALHFAPPEAAAFRGTAKRWDVTPNDLMIAILLQALSPLAEGRRSAKRRKEIAIASVVNLRRDFDAPAATTFGQFLSSFHVTHPVPPGATLRELAADVHAQSSAIREERRYYQTLIGISALNQILRFMSPERRTRFHMKSFPIWAGTTPVNVDAAWQEAGGNTFAPDYVRGVSTGPLIPLVVAVTQAAGALNVGFTFRTAAFNPEDIDKMLTGIRDAFRCLRGDTGRPQTGVNETAAEAREALVARSSSPRSGAATVAVRMGFAQ